MTKALTIRQTVELDLAVPAPGQDGFILCAPEA